MTCSWKYAFASVIGTYHLSRGLPCQDAIRVCLCRLEKEDVLLAVVSDGAGSAARGDEGSDIACQFFIEKLQDFVLSGSEICTLDRELCIGWVKDYLSHLEERANSCEAQISDYASTLLAAVVGSRSAVFLQIGDGAIVASTEDDPDSYTAIFWPQKGEYESTTFFLTDNNSHENLLILSLDGVRICDLAIFTDGLQRIALDFTENEAYNPFFRGMFNPLRGQFDGYLQELSEQLKNFLGSPRVNEYTEDDKTLLLASRVIGQQLSEVPD